MGSSATGGMRRSTYALWIFVIVAIVVAQSIVYLVLTLHLHEYHTEFDLDRSNGIPDLISTVVLALGTLGAAVLAAYEDGINRILASIAVLTLAALTLADLLHDGAHPTQNHGSFVILLAAGTVAIVILIALTAGTRARITLGLGVALLAASFFVSQLKHFDPSFGRRGDRSHELQIVAKEGFEVGGWALVGLGLWEVALLRRSQFLRLTAPTSPEPVAPRQRAA